MSANVAIGVGKRELHRLDLAVPALRAPVRRLVHGGAFDDPERLQRGDALPVRRDLPDLVVPIRDGDRLHPLAVKRREIVAVKQTAGGLRVLGNARCDLAFIEVPRPLRCQPPQGRRMPRTAPNLARVGGAASEREHPCPLLQGRISGPEEDGAGPAPELRDDRRDREAALRVPDRGGEQSVEPHPARTARAGHPTHRGRRARRRSSIRVRGT